MPAPHAITKTLALPDGRQISIETGKLAKFADGAVVVRLGDTMLLATWYGLGTGKKKSREPSSEGSLLPVVGLTCGCPAP